MKTVMNYMIETVVLHITTCCTHQCPFCYFINDSVVKKHQEISVLKNIVVEVARAGAKRILFVGGDPASHPDVVDLADTAKNVFNMETSILSNTLFFANNTREQIINAFDYIEMTIHRYDKNAHDAFCRKKGAYEFGIHNFKSFESPNVHLGIVYNLTPETFYDIFKVVQQVKEVDNINIDHVVFQRIAPIGRAYQQDIWNLSQIDLMSIFTQMEKIENEYEINISLEDTFPLCKVPLEYRGKYVRSCSWGYDRCSLDMYGNVSKCCTDPRYTLGNVLNTPLLELWNTSSELDKKRNGGFIPQSCRDCGLYAECGGGCVLSSEMNGCLGDVLLNH